MTSVRTSDGLAGIAAISVRDGAGDLQSVSAASVRTATGLKPFFGSMSVTAEPGGPGGFQNSGSTVLVTTGAVVATPSGGAPPYTYDWNQIGASDWTIDSPTAATTTFSILTAPGEVNSALFSCTVTDSLGFEATSNEVNPTATNLGGGGLA